MKGLDLAEKYYYAVGRPAMERELPEALPFLAAGLCGDGSDCLGFDDEISGDHDFGPGFCIWLENAAYERFGEKLQELYDRLPGEFEGFPARKNDPNSGKRVGVFRITEFYGRFIGSEQPPASDRRWYLFSDDRLAACTSGKVFEDGPGAFTAIREVLLSYYPESVRINKMASVLHLIAQTGQYNYARCMERGDTVAASFTLNEFIRNVIHLVHLLDQVYEPYYKWAWKSFTQLPDSEGLVQPLKKLTELPVSAAAWQGSYGPGLNYKDEKVLLIETVCGRLLKLLQREGLTSRTDSFLDAHVGEVAGKAQD